MIDYRIEFEDDEIEVICCENDNDAIQEAWDLESIHGTVFNVIRLDDNFNKVETIY